jgi:hypothetical protein
VKVKPLRANVFFHRKPALTLVVTNENGDSISNTITVTVVDPKQQ